jgi:hypothetical protein
MKGLTINEMRNEIKRIKFALLELPVEQNLAVLRRMDELLLHSGVNTTPSGNVRCYLPKCATKAQVEDYLTQYINALYDCGLGHLA